MLPTTLKAKRNVIWIGLNISSMSRRMAVRLTFCWPIAWYTLEIAPSDLQWVYDWVRCKKPSPDNCWSSIYQSAENDCKISHIQFMIQVTHVKFCPEGEWQKMSVLRPKHKLANRWVNQLGHSVPEVRVRLQNKITEINSVDEKTVGSPIRHHFPFTSVTE